LNNKAKTKQREQAAKLYTHLLEEIQIRLSSIEDALSGKLPLSPMLTREFCFLQIRMICELVASGCLVMHGDIPATREGRLQKAWKADVIMAELGKIHTNFYPRPVRQKLLTDPSVPGPRKIHLEPLKSGFFSRDELIRLYGKCGDVLHKGNLKRLLKPGENLQWDTAETIEIISKLRGLLDQHQILSLDCETLYVCGYDPATKKVFVSIAGVVVQADSREHP